MIYLMMVDIDEDRDKFTILYDKYRKLMQTVCYKVLQDDYLAEDATHDAFIKLAKNMDKIKNIESHETKRYLITIAKNSAIDIYRRCASRRMHEVCFDEREALEKVTIDENLGEDDKVIEILKQLPALYRDVLLLKYSNGFSNVEIAAILNISEENVRQRISRGKKIVKKELDKEGI